MSLIGLFTFRTFNILLGAQTSLLQGSTRPLSAVPPREGEFQFESHKERHVGRARIIDVPELPRERAATTTPNGKSSARAPGVDRAINLSPRRETRTAETARRDPGNTGRADSRVAISNIYNRVVSKPCPRAVLARVEVHLRDTRNSVDEGRSLDSLLSRATPSSSSVSSSGASSPPSAKPVPPQSIHT